MYPYVIKTGSCEIKAYNHNGLGEYIILFTGIEQDRQNEIDEIIYESQTRNNQTFNRQEVGVAMRKIDNLICYKS